MQKIGVILMVAAVLSGGVSGYLFHRANYAEKLARGMKRSNYGSRLGRRILRRIAKKRRTRGTIFGGAAGLLLISGLVMAGRSNRQSVAVSSGGKDNRPSGSA